MKRASELQFKTIRVSQKGQIAIPADMQREIGIRKGDELLLIRKGERIVLEKPKRVAKKMEDEFSDVQEAAERSLRRLWLNEGDEVWNQYLKGSRK